MCIYKFFGIEKLYYTIVYNFHIKFSKSQVRGSKNKQFIGKI